MCVLYPIPTVPIYKNLGFLCLVLIESNIKSSRESLTLETFHETTVFRGPKRGEPIYKKWAYNIFT